MITFIEIFLIAIGLAMDAFAVSVSNGLSMKKVSFSDASKIALFTGGFQGLFPYFGWLLGLIFSTLIVAFDHWIALILLSMIGGKMIFEGIQYKKKEISIEPKKLTIFYLITLGIATSIDALAVGVTFALLDQPILIPVLTIGIVTFGISILGVYTGNMLGSRLKDKAEILGGLTLIILGIKILIEHIFF